MRSKVFRVVLTLAVMTGTLVLSALMTAAVTADGPKTAVGSGATSSADIAGGRVAEAYQKHELIRFHVIANSDSELDQALKMKIRDIVVQQMTPEFTKAKNLIEARAVAKDNLPQIEELAAQEVKAWGKTYPVSVQLGRFDFPVKSYGSLTLPADEYEAVRIVIGQGQGANWWCVLFPPLCFVDVSKSLPSQEIGIVEQSQGKSQPVYKVRFKLLELLGKSYH